MRRTAIDHLLDDLHDTCEIVVRESHPGCELQDAWRAARQDARDAYDAWRAAPGSAEAYAVYVAAEDRADAALDALALDAIR